MYTTPEEHARRNKLYESGLSDVEMALICFVCVNAIRYWREKHNPKLPPNAPKQEKATERLLLYSSGLSDIEIAKAQQCSKMAIRDWRKKRNLPQNKKEKEKKHHASN